MRQEVREVILIPWELRDLSPRTREDYQAKAKYLLEAAGLVDPSKMLHRKRPPLALVKIQREEITSGMRRFIVRSKEDPNYAKQTIKDFIERESVRVERNELSPGSISTMLAPFSLALQVNEVPVIWKNLSRLIPSYNPVAEDRPYALAEVQAILSHASLHLQVPILLMASSGIRVGAFDYLKVGHITPVLREEKAVCGKMLVYAGERERYFTLISLEALTRFEEYVRFRKERHEDVTPLSPAVVTRDLSRRLDSDSIAPMVNRLLWDSGIRKEKKKRHEFKQDHGLRKLYDNVVNQHMDKVYVEMLIGHTSGNLLANMLKVSRHYDRDVPDPVVEQYLRAMPELTVERQAREAAFASIVIDQEKAKNRELEGKTTLEVLKLEKQVRDQEKASSDQERRMRELERIVELMAQGKGKLVEE